MVRASVSACASHHMHACSSDSLGPCTSGDLSANAKLTTDPNGGVAPLGERLEAWDALAGARLDAVAEEALCKVGAQPVARRAGRGGACAQNRQISSAGMQAWHVG